MFHLRHREDDRLPELLRPVGIVLFCVGAWLRWWVVLDVPIDLGWIGILFVALGPTTVLTAIVVEGTWTTARAARHPELEHQPTRESVASDERG